jgi:hypothetical protein
MSELIGIECPICQGLGNVKVKELPESKIAEMREVAAIKLIGDGYGIREIQRAIGYKSPQSVSRIKKAMTAQNYTGVNHETI